MFFYIHKHVHLGFVAANQYEPLIAQNPLKNYTTLTLEQ